MKITESRLRSIIQGVIRETRYGLSPESNYTYPGETGSEIDLQQLEQIYMGMVPLGGRFIPLMDRVKNAYERECGSCGSCEVLDITEVGEGASFVVRGDNGKECQLTLKMSSFGGPEIVVDSMSSGTGAVEDYRMTNRYHDDEY